MKADEIRAMPDTEIAEALDSVHREMFNLRFQRSVGQLADPNRLRTLRREHARILTIRREREIWAAYEATVASPESEQE